MAADDKITGFEAFFAWVTGMAPTVFQRDGHHVPMLFLQKNDGDGWGVMQLPWQSPQEKERTYQALAITFRRRPANAYVFVCEAWALKTKTGTVIEGSISEEADRIEILTVYGADSRGKRRTKVWRIERDLDGVASLVADNLIASAQLEARLDQILLHQPAANIELRDGTKQRQN